jgi:hypothetical protein
MAANVEFPLPIPPLDKYIIRAFIHQTRRGSPNFRQRLNPPYIGVVVEADNDPNDESSVFDKQVMYLPIHPAMKNPKGKVAGKYIIFDGILNVYEELSVWMDPFYITKSGICLKCYPSGACNCEDTTSSYKVSMIRLVL